MVAALKFGDTDYHNLIDLLVEAVKVTEATGHRPSVVVNGKTYAPYDLTKVAALLPHNEQLNERHAALVATIFGRRQRGYGRTAYKLAHRANQIASDTVSWSWMHATPKEAEQAIPTPDELAALIKDEIEMGDMAGEKAKAPYNRRIGEMMLRAKCRKYISSAAKRRRP